MPKISVNHTSSVPPEQAMLSIKNFFETDKDLQRIDSKIQCQFSTSEGKGKVTGSQFKADVQVSPNAAGSQILVVIDLPLILTPFKSKVEETIKKKLAKYLA